MCRPAGSAGFECVFGLDSLLHSKIGRTDTHTDTHTQTNKTLSIFPPALAPTRPGLPCVYTHTSLDLTALDPYGDQNNSQNLSHRPDPRNSCTAVTYRTTLLAIMTAVTNLRREQVNLVKMVSPPPILARICHAYSPVLLFPNDVI